MKRRAARDAEQRAARLARQAEQIARLAFLDDPARGRAHAAEQRAQQGSVPLPDLRGYYTYHLGLADPGEDGRTWGPG